MKKIALVLAIGVLGLLGYNYVATGELKLIPGRALSAEQRELKELEKQFDAARKQVGQAHRAAGTTGIDMTADVEAARRSLDKIQRALADLKQRLESDSAKRDADRLARAVKDYSRELR